MPQNFSKVEQEKIINIGKDVVQNLGDKSSTIVTENSDKIYPNVQEECEDRIAKSFENQTIFITGGTGFLGKVIIEKLLRCCFGFKRIYLLVRSKKGIHAQERLKDLFNSELFELVKELRGEEAVLSQVCCIEGDCTLPNLGISEEDRKIIEKEVTVIYHCAATIRFDESLKKAVLLNTRGTKFMLDLARTCKNLKFFAYISTAYCHLDVEHLMERPYPPPADPEKIIKVCEELDEVTIDSMTKSMLGDIPNTYAFTKSLAEHLVVQSFKELPTVILRPSIVIPIWKEPIPGWTDNINGPTGLLIGAGKGVLRSMMVKETSYGDFLPVDVAVNGILISTWHTLYNNKFVNRVSHMTSSQEIKIPWSEILEMGRWVIENRVPLNGVAWYPGGSMKSNRLYHNICLFFFHWVPAVIVDCLLFCLGYPPVLCRVQRRIMKGFEVFEYYCNRQWSFDNTEAVKMRRELNELERHKYIIEAIDLDLVKYFENSVLCARRYILKTPDDMIPAAKRHMKIMWIVDRGLRLIFWTFILYKIYTWFLASYFE